MTTSATPTVSDEIFAAIEAAVTDGKITNTAQQHLRRWLTEPHLADYRQQIVDHVEQGMWQELDDAFWTVIPFGTGGRRGRMYPIGPGAINERTIGESAMGLATYVRGAVEAGMLKLDGPLACAIAYDTRHRSREFAELCAEVMVASGFQVYFLDGYRSTPELSFTVREKKCACGVMITASHNPPSDNAVKAYWATGGQLLPPHDNGVIDCVMQVTDIPRANFAEALGDGRVVYCQDEMDPAFFDAVCQQAFDGPRDLKVVYSPLHGVGASCVVPVLKQAGFGEPLLYGPQAQPSGDFPNVPGHVSNPENAAVFDDIATFAQQQQADIALATDPDCDRIGASAPLTYDANAKWEVLTGNQLAALIGDYLLGKRAEAGTLSSRNFIATTLVTTQLVHKVAAAHGVRTFGDLLVGFKWIAGVIDEQGPGDFLYGTEESHGYMAGQHVRDKDGAVASLLLCLLAAELKSQGKTLHLRLAELFREHGAHAERTISIMMPGSEGMAEMKALMQRLRDEPPQAIGAYEVMACRDYLSQQSIHPNGSKHPLEGPRGDLVIFDLEGGRDRVAVRPSGTEPKVKFYLFAANEPAEDVAASRRQLTARLDEFESALRELTGQAS